MTIAPARKRMIPLCDDSCQFVRLVSLAGRSRRYSSIRLAPFFPLSVSLVARESANEARRITFPKESSCRTIPSDHQFIRGITLTCTIIHVPFCRRHIVNIRLCHLPFLRRNHMKMSYFRRRR
jgi:hypothetical protein